MKGVGRGLPRFTLGGLPEGTIKESRERITAAIANSGFAFPVRRITCNLAPAEMRKIGSGFDLPGSGGGFALLWCRRLAGRRHATECKGFDTYGNP